MFRPMATGRSAAAAAAAAEYASAAEVPLAGLAAPAAAMGGARLEVVPAMAIFRGAGAAAWPSARGCQLADAPPLQLY